MAQDPPLWGVMYHDGSVAHRWNGRTQRQRAEEHLEATRRRHREWLGRETTDHLTLAHRKDADSPWERVED